MHEHTIAIVIEHFHVILRKDTTSFSKTEISVMDDVTYKFQHPLSPNFFQGLSWIAFPLPPPLLIY